MLAVSWVTCISQGKRALGEMPQCYQEIASFQVLPLHTFKISAHMVGQVEERLSTLLTETHTHTHTPLSRFLSVTFVYVPDFWFLPLTPETS